MGLKQLDTTEQLTQHTLWNLVPIECGKEGATPILIEL